MADKARARDVFGFGAAVKAVCTLALCFCACTWACGNVWVGDTQMGCHARK